VDVIFHASRKAAKTQYTNETGLVISLIFSGPIELRRWRVFVDERMVRIPAKYSEGKERSRSRDFKKYIYARFQFAWNTESHELL
jgi:hypothetical protein